MANANKRRARKPEPLALAVLLYSQILSVSATEMVKSLDISNCKAYSMLTFLSL